MRKLLIPILLFSFHFTNGQEITKDFTKLLHDEDFYSSSSEKWEDAFNSDNLFLIQNGYYELYRRNKTSGYFIFPKEERSYESAEMVASLSFEKHKNKKQSAGLIIMSQQNLSGGLVIELSPKLGYRVQRISSSGSSSITTGKDGWVKSKLVSSTGNNDIKIKTYLKIFDLYINDNYVFTFSDIEYFKGGIGIFIGPNSKCKFDKISIHGEEEIDLANTVINTKEKEDLSLTQIIVKLRKTLNAKDKEIEGLEDKLARSQRTTTVDTASRRINRELRAENSALKSEAIGLKNKANNLEAELSSLRKFKKDLEESTDGGDIVINLTNIVGRQNGEIAKLKTENSYYKKETEELKAKAEVNDIELKRVSETNILIREILIEKDELIKKQEKDIRTLKRTGGKLKEDSEEEGEDEDELEIEEEEKPKDKNDLLNQILEKEKRDREKKKKEEDKNK